MLILSPNIMLPNFLKKNKNSTFISTDPASLLKSEGEIGRRNKDMRQRGERKHDWLLPPSLDRRITFWFHPYQMLILSPSSCCPVSSEKSTFMHLYRPCPTALPAYKNGERKKKKVRERARENVIDYCQSGCDWFVKFQNNCPSYLKRPDVWPVMRAPLPGNDISIIRHSSGGIIHELLLSMNSFIEVCCY